MIFSATIVAATTVESRARRKIALRILPFLWLLYIIAFLDRVNVAFAALEMSHDLHFSDKVFGLGTGIFFLGYVLLEIPGALIVERWSARRWIARIMISWGIVTILIGLVKTSGQFYMARFLLGVAEAGFFPGVIVYLTHWFSRRDLAKAIASFMAAQPIANLIGSPIAGKLLQVHWHGLEGWRWLFFIEGVPAILVGVVTVFYLTDWPRQAYWLAPDEREWIIGELDRESKAKSAVRSHTIAQALRRPEVIMLAAIYFLATTGIYGFTLWFPTIVKRASGSSISTVTSLLMLPYLAGLLAILFNGWHSDRHQERRWHAAGFLFGGCISLFLATLFSAHFSVQFTFLTLCVAFIYGYQPCFWPLPTITLGESAAAACIGLINSLGNIGGFAGPYIAGYLSTRTGSFNSGMLWMMASLLAAGILILCLKEHRQRG
jgi:MFS transporter, ACS family, tartrate transporter